MAPALCVPPAAGVFVAVDAADFFFFFNHPHLAPSEKQTLAEIISGGASKREPEETREISRGHWACWI